jgi:hypothetical protein
VSSMRVACLSPNGLSSVISQISETYAQVMVQAIGDANCKAETE